MPDREVVLLEDLVPYLKAWLARQDKLYYQEWGVQHLTDYKHVGEASTPFTPLSRLAFEAGVETRNLYRILNMESGCTDVLIADRLLKATDNWGVELPVYDRYEAIAATTEQTRMMPMIARCAGKFLAAAGRNRKTKFTVSEAAHWRRELMAA